MLVLIHPTNPDVVYFFLDGHLLGVDLRARKVVECEVYELVQPPLDQLREHVASRFLHAWQLPPAFCSGDSTEFHTLCTHIFLVLIDVVQRP